MRADVGRYVPLLLALCSTAIAVTPWVVADSGFGRTTLLRQIDLLNYLLPGMVAAGAALSVPRPLREKSTLQAAGAISVGLVPLAMALQCWAVGAETRGELGQWMLQSLMVGGLPSAVFGVMFAWIATLRKSECFWLHSRNWVAVAYASILVWLLWQQAVGIGTI
ncbi:MAG: hypothetical protein Q8P31_07615 [Bacillota bacterium]|nr:hypothetical protein [Bacillota bacterium]